MSGVSPDISERSGNPAIRTRVEPATVTSLTSSWYPGRSSGVVIREKGDSVFVRNSSEDGGVKSAGQTTTTLL